VLHLDPSKRATAISRASRLQTMKYTAHQIKEILDIVYID